MSDEAANGATVEDHVLGRVGAMEILTAQAVSILLSNFPPEQREELAGELLVRIEDKLPGLTPIQQRIALKQAERVMSCALVTAAHLRNEPPANG